MVHEDVLVLYVLCLLDIMDGKELVLVFQVLDTLPARIDLCIREEHDCLLRLRQWKER